MPGRRLGQHFLRDDATARRLVERAGVERGTTVLEVGPGTGRLTRALLDVARRVVALEIDRRLAEELPRRVEDPSRLVVVEADAARADLAALLDRYLEAEERAHAVGALPYSAATAILAGLLAARRRLRGIAVVVQREVAERITAPPGGRTYGYLSVLCQDEAEAVLAHRLRPGAFHPRPAVHSALVCLELRGKPLRGDLDRERFLAFVGRLFRWRRKTILNNLQAAAGLARPEAERVLASVGVEPTLRPQDLSVIALASLQRALPSSPGAAGL